MAKECFYHLFNIGIDEYKYRYRKLQSNSSSIYKGVKTADIKLVYNQKGDIYF